MGGPMQTPPAQPELSGLLDDNFATMLEEMLAADPQESIPQCPELSFLQNLAPAEDRTPSLPAFAQQQQAPQGWEPPAHDQHEGWSFEKKRSGSGDSHSGAHFCEGETTDLLAKRQKAHHEKNKRAQKRYREKKKAQSEEQKHQIDALTAQLEHLTASKAQLESRCHLLEKVVKMREEPINANPQRALEVTKEVPPFVTATSTFLSMVYPGQGLEKSLQQEHVERMNGHDFRKVMQDFRSRLVKLMVDANDDPQTPAYKEIEQLVEAQRWATNCLILHNPVKMMRVAYQVRSAVDGQGACNWIVDQAIQQRVLDALQLSLEKKRRIVENRRQLLLNLEQLLRKQNMVVDLLQNSMPLRYDDLSASQAFLKATMAVNDLTTDLHKHHGAVRDFMRELLSSVLTPYEEARCHVEAWPHYPDALMISNMIAEELGDCTANAKLLQFDRHRTLPVPEMPLQLMGGGLVDSALNEQPFAPL
ncbi:g2196 [Coccomyxa viridis]|uniref:G2196 protein n=1 Tax=Coccomyxa viridis TaxID=1274662 RepID=A0ABP1FJS8_9CHLO